MPTNSDRHSVKTSRRKRETQLRYHDTSLMLRLTEGQTPNGSSVEDGGNLGEGEGGDIGAGS